MDTMDLYRLAQDGFDAVLATVGPDRWDGPSACAEWSVRDVAGHATWGQHQLRAWATGEDYQESTGGPGSVNPGALTGEDPVAAWREAREQSLSALTQEALTTPTSIPGLGEVPLVAVVTLLTTDLAVHTWDVGHALGAPVRLDSVLVSVASEWTHANAVRRPGFFGPELTAPDGADEQTRMLAFVGRAQWAPVRG
jgi:uncharacterized protein (TIGR03086 family)